MTTRAETKFQVLKAAARFYNS